MRRLGKYRLEHCLGRGGMGEVWKAVDESLQRTVAIKLLLQQESEDVARFRREAELAARLHHPNIAAVYEFGEADGVPFLAMQFVEGRPLGRETLTIRQAVEAVRDAALAVHEAHGQGIIHRDLKPDNVLRAADGRVVVLDFGLAKSVRGGASLSVSGAILGTPSYMAPEQAAGLRLDRRADVYGLGATLYQLVTGKPPFVGDELFQILRRVVESEPLAPRAIAPDIPRDVETIVLHAMEKDAAKRYPTAKDFADDLDRWLLGEPILARPPGAAARMGKRIRKHPWRAVAALAFAAALGVAAWAAIRDRTLTRNQLEALERARAADRAAAAGERKSLLLQESASRIRDAEDALVDPRSDLARIRAVLEEERAKLDAARAEFPGVPSFPYWQARACELLGRDREAEALYDEVLKTDPKDARCRYDRARLRVRNYFASYHVLTYLEQGSEFRRNAEEDLAQIGQGVLTTREEELLACVRMLTFCKFDDLRKHCRDRIAAGGRTEEFYFYLGMAALIESRPAEAEPHFSAAIDRNPRHLYALFHRSSPRVDRGDFAGAISDLTRTIEIRPDFAPGYAARAAARGRSGDLEGAIADSTKALEIDPRMVDAWTNRALARFAREEYAQAIADVDRAIEIRPGDGGLFYRRGMYRRRAGDLSGAIADCTQAIALLKQPAEAHLQRAFCHEGLKNWNEAISDYSRTLELDPKEPTAYNNRARCYHMLGRIADAIDDLNRAVELAPGFADAWLNRSFAREKIGDPAGAREDCAKALDVAPPDWPHRARAEQWLRKLSD